MEGSTAMRCRSLGILACTVLGPVLAVLCPSWMESGNGAPGDMARGDASPAQASPNTASALRLKPDSAQSADILRGQGPARIAAVRTTSYETAAAWQPDARGSRSDGLVAEEPSPVAAAIDRLSRSRPQPHDVVGEPRSGGPRRLVPVAEIEGAGAEGNAGARPDRPGYESFQGPGSGSERLVAPRGGLGRSGTRPAPADDRFTFASIHERLRELGATYCRLETCGDAGDRFLFQCRVARGPGAGPQRALEAVAADPIEAMADVLRQAQSLQAPEERN